MRNNLIILIILETFLCLQKRPISIYSIVAYDENNIPNQTINEEQQPRIYLYYTIK